jgi:hypothetical protein
MFYRILPRDRKTTFVAFSKDDWFCKECCLSMSRTYRDANGLAKKEWLDKAVQHVIKMGVVGGLRAYFMAEYLAEQCVELEIQIADLKNGLGIEEEDCEHSENETLP